MKMPVAPVILAAALAAAPAIGCFAPNALRCSDGVTCPVGMVCDVATHSCATAEQQAACAALEEGARCAVSAETGVCRSGVCTELQVLCGDGVVDEGEECDGTDVGATTCQMQGFYGGSLGCSTFCSLDVSGCSGYCGDGVVNGPELCDGAAPDPGRLGCVDYGWDRGALGCSAACQASSSRCVKFGVTTTAPLGSEALAPFLYGVWANGPNDVWTFGSTVLGAGTVVGPVPRYDGTSWSSHWFGIVLALGGSGPNDMFIAELNGDQTDILHYDGRGYAPVSIGAISIQAIWASGPGDAFAVGDSLLHWDGATWSPVSIADLGPLRRAETFSSVWGSGSKDVFVASTYGKVVHWDGTIWTVIRAGADQAVGATHLSVTGRDNAYLVAGPSIFHWDGVDWTALDTTDLPSAPVGAWGSGADDVFAFLGDGALVHWDGNGRTTLRVGDPHYQVRAVWSDGHEAFAVGHDTRPPPPPPHCSAATNGPPMPSDGRAGSSGGGGAPPCPTQDGASLLLRWDGNGWFPIAGDPPSGIDLHALWGRGERDLYGLGAGADGATVIARWDGRGWATVADSLPRLVRLWGTAAGDLYAAGQGLFHWDGTTATEVAAGDFSGVSGTGADDVFAWGAGGIAHWDGSGWTTTDASIGIVNDVWGSGRGDAFAVGPGGAIARWNGTRWSPMASGTTDDLRRVWGRSSTDVFAAGAAGRMLHWDGSVWATMSTPVAGDFVYIGGDGGGDVFAATDGQLAHLVSGVWERVAIPDVGVARDLWATPTRLFVLGSGGRVYLNRASVTCGRREYDCNDGWDNDCDGLQDAYDPDC